jgi:hypothetical protein
MKSFICDAIHNKNLIELIYEGHKRVVEPHCYGVSTAGNEALRLYQVDGYSSTRTMGWKMYDLSKARNITVLDETFNSPRPGYKRNDRGMSKIYCQL